ncbi:MAG: MarR family winged helix-turn-helix transcriptional regulator [Catenulispora sp.]
MSGIGNNTTRIQTLARAIGAAETAAVADSGLTVPQYRALEALENSTAGSVAMLADRLGISRQAAQTLTSTLALKHLIRRSATAASGRTLHITLTPTARAALRRARAGIAEVEAAFTSAYRPEQIDRLRALLADGLAALPSPQPRHADRTDRAAASRLAAAR